MQSELAALRERAITLERERTDHAAGAEAARTALKAQEQRSDALQQEVASLSQRLDAERNRWVREADEAHAAAIRLEEERRSASAQQQAEDHKRQIAKLNAAYKKSLQKARDETALSRASETYHPAAAGKSSSSSHM